MDTMRTCTNLVVLRVQGRLRFLWRKKLLKVKHVTVGRKPATIQIRTFNRVHENTF
jgi:hypothetical protein